MKGICDFLFEKLVINRQLKKTVKISGIAEEIVITYFGYIPASLEEEGMKCSSEAEIYKLVEKMENFYMNQENSKDPETEDEIQKIHKDLTEWVKETNKR